MHRTGPQGFLHRCDAAPLEFGGAEYSPTTSFSL
jgi:hypothetical protein